MATQATSKPTQANPMTASQAAFLRDLAKTVVGDGQDYLRQINEKYKGETTSAQASAEIKHLQSLKAGARPLVQGKGGRATTTAPEGKYAVSDSQGYPVIVEVSKPTGRWEGYTFVKSVPMIPNGTDEPVRGVEATHILNAIERDPVTAAVNYGRMTGRCGQCNRRLSDPTSVAMGIGPECRSNFG